MLRFEYAQVELKSTHDFFLQIFLKNGCPENFINVPRDLRITYTKLKRFL